jgi:hypothetical protein
VPLLTLQSAKGYGFGKLAAAAGIVSDYEAIQTYSLSSGGTGSVTFNSGGVWANYKHLQVRWVAKCSRAAPNATMLMTFNGVNGGTGNYIAEQVEWDGTGPFYPSSGGFSANTGLAGNTYANYFSIGYGNIYNINSTSVTKPFYASGVFQQGGGASGQNNWTITCGSFIANTNAITSITLAPDSGTFNANTKIALYGLK